MSRSLIYTVNGNPQEVIADGAVSLGTVIRRYGCNLALSGDGIVARGAGYYTIDGSLTVVPTAAGEITATMYRDGVAIPGATATVTAAAAGDYVALPIVGVVRETCCDSASTITCALSAAAGVTNVAMKIEKS